MDTGFLTDKEIKENKEYLFEEGFDDRQAEGASYDLSLGDEVYISGENYPRKLSENTPFVSLPRGQFALLMTKEYVKMPQDCFGLISIKFWKKAQGLINVSGFHVDPGFEGRILFSVFNAGPSDVVLKNGEPTFMIFFYKLRGKVQHPYDGDMKEQMHLPTKLVTSLKGTSASLSEVDRKARDLEITIKLHWALIIVLFGALVTLLIRTWGI